MRTLHGSELDRVCPLSGAAEVDGTVSFPITAACAGRPQLMFDPGREREALALCAVCEHHDACRRAWQAEVARNRVQGIPVNGVWFGTTPRDRQNKGGRRRLTDEEKAARLKARLDRERAERFAAIHGRVAV